LLNIMQGHRRRDSTLPQTKGEQIRAAEQRVRARIRRAFSQKRYTGGTMDVIEDHVVQLIKEYCSAPEGRKEEVYERGERKLLQLMESDRKT
jgi:hypothetical protein